MGKMTDNFRAWWHSMASSLEDPGKLAQLSVADLERSVRSAKEAASAVIGRPEALADIIAELAAMDAELTQRITALVNLGSAGQDAARPYVARQVAVRKQLAEARDELVDAAEAAAQWQERIAYLERELLARRHLATRRQAEYEYRRGQPASEVLHPSVDPLVQAYDSALARIKDRLDKEKAIAAGHSAMAGLAEKARDDRLINEYETDLLMVEYLTKLKK